ncbi:MAG: hypothetical protein KGR16_03510 [Verrucomicrobia bacterium]|nr:hypothetical protein [Verrucomicrobiota bacterium]MDE3047947.1 hypothetical protein [Verrucomicrobiota bacterium]
MKRILLLVYILTVSGCIQQLSSNLERSNELMCQNIQAMGESRQTIEENTHQITRSTNTMIGFQFIFPIFLAIVLLALTLILFRFSRKLSKLFKDKH